MRTDYDGPVYPERMTELASVVQAQLDEYAGCIIDWEELARAPEHGVALDVHEYAKLKIEAERDWEEGAKDRPHSERAYTAEMRLFDGEWFPRLEMLHGVTADLPVGTGDDLEVMRYSEQPWAAYMDLVDLGDEAKCRRFAFAWYEARGMHRRASSILVSTIRELIR